MKRSSMSAYTGVRFLTHPIHTQNVHVM